MRIISIDSKRFYGKELNEQNIVILFQIPSGANENDCETYLKDIYRIVIEAGNNLFSSEIVSRTQWNDNVIKIIGNSLYVRKGEHVIVPEGMNCVFGKQVDDLFVENKLVAKIQTDKRKGIVNKTNRFIIVSCILCILAVLLFVLFYDSADETNTTNTESVIEMKTNEQGYSEDILIPNNNQEDVMEKANLIDDDSTDELISHDNNGESSSYSEEHLDNHKTTHNESDHVIMVNESYSRKKQNEDIYVQERIDQEFNSLVSEADKYYRKYFDGDESAARHAIKKYDEALKIKFNSMVSKRRELLRKEIER